MESLKKICRTCLLEKGAMYSVNTSGTVLGQKAVLSDILQSFANVQINRNDGLPQMICMLCIEHITQAYIFKTLCEKNQEQLKCALSNSELPINPISVSHNTSSFCQIIFKDESISDDDNKCNIESLKKNLVYEDDKNSISNIDTQGPRDTEIIIIDNTAKKCKYNKFSQDIKNKCKICSEHFYSDSSLKLHYYSEHGGLPESSKCILCSKVCRSEDQMKRHMNIHNTGKPFQCEECGKTYTQKPAYISHTYSHTGERPILCTQCGKMFKDKGELKIHMRIHLDLRPYTCEICGKNYRTASLFAIHRRVHSGERPFPCTYCDKRFISSDSLRNHVMIHTGEKPYICDFCGRSFNRSHALRIHRKTHTGERPHVCSACGKSFIQAHCLKSHMNTH